jgi:hypothetical protein
MSNSKLFLGALLACAASASFAQEFKPQLWLNPGLFSFHADRNANYREENWGFGAEYRFRRDHAGMAGFYTNSERRQSKYLGYQWRPWHWRHDDFDVSAGAAVALIDGYPRQNNGGFFVAPMPMVSIEGQRFGANVILVPNVRNGAAIAVQFKLKIW